MKPSGDRPDYLRKREFFDRLITIYGRKPVHEALLDSRIKPFRLHLSKGNRPNPLLDELVQLAQRRGAEVQTLRPEELARISRNAKQDQGVALDIQCPSHNTLSEWLAEKSYPVSTRLLALDGITNPQNLGMILRSAAAGRIDGVLLPQRGCAAISPLVVKASAGALFHCPILRCNELPKSLQQLQQKGFSVAILAGEAPHSLLTFKTAKPTVFVLGNESEGVSPAVRQLADTALSIPMNNGVESLNVAVTAALIAFLG